MTERFLFFSLSVNALLSKGYYFKSDISYNGLGLLMIHIIELHNYCDIKQDAPRHPKFMQSIVIIIIQ